MTITNQRINEAVSSHVTPISESGSVKPSNTPVQLSRAQILEATFFCLREEGYEATTIRRIAKRLNCAIGSIYRYFRDKRDLLSAVTQELLQPVIVGLENGTPVDRSVGMYCRLATGDTEAYRLMFWLACKGQYNTDLPDVVKAIIEGWTQKIGDVERAANLWALLHGLIILSRPEDQIIAQALAQLGQTSVEAKPEVVIMPNLQIPTPAAITPSQEQSSMPATPEDVTLL